MLVPAVIHVLVNRDTGGGALAGFAISPRGGRGVAGLRIPTAVADLHPGKTVLDLGSGVGQTF